MIEVVDDPFASGVLDPEVHARLVADIDNLSAVAGIQKRWISRPLAETCGPEEITWVRQFRRLERPWLAYVGQDAKLTVPDRMAAITGALTRNFVFAKLVQVNAWVEVLRDGEDIEASCLLVPNFFVDRAKGGAQPEWRVSLLLDALMDRYQRRRPTVLYVSDATLLGKEYGLGFARLIENAYTMIPV